MFKLAVLVTVFWLLFMVVKAPFGTDNIGASFLGGEGFALGPQKKRIEDTTQLQASVNSGELNSPFFALFASETCGHCKLVMPDWIKFINTRSTGVGNGALTLYGNKATDRVAFDYYGVKAVPYLMVFRLNAEPARVMGADNIKSVLAAAMAGPNPAV